MPSRPPGHRFSVQQLNESGWDLPTAVPSLVDDQCFAVHFGKELGHQVGLTFDPRVSHVDVTHPAVGGFVHLSSVGVDPCVMPKFSLTVDGGHQDVERGAVAFEGGLNAKTNGADQGGPRASVRTERSSIHRKEPVTRLDAGFGIFKGVVLRPESRFGLHHAFNGPVFILVDPVDAHEPHCVGSGLLASAVEHAPTARQVVGVTHIEFGNHLPNHSGNILTIAAVIQHDQGLIQGGIPVHGVHVLHVERVPEQTPSVDDHLSPRFAWIKIQEQSLDQDRFRLHAHGIEQIPSFKGGAQHARPIRQWIENKRRTVKICFRVHVVGIDGDMQWWLFRINCS